MAGKRAIIHRMAAGFGMAVIAVAVTACGETCTDNRNALPYAAFNAVMDSVMQRVSVDSLEVRGIGAPGDSILVEAGAPVSTVYLPFRIDSDTTLYAFTIRQGLLEISDTVTFNYTRSPRFVSHECGVSYLFDIKDITWTGQMIDSVVCKQGYIDNTPGINMEIYLRSGENETEWED